MSYRVRRVWEYRLRNYFANTQAALERAQAAAAQKAAEEQKENPDAESEAQVEVSSDMLRAKMSNNTRIVYPSNAYNTAIANARDRTKYATYITTYNKGFERDSY